MASVNLILGLILSILGFILGATIWTNSLISGVATTPGSAALIVVLLVLGQQMLLSFLSIDFSNEPSIPLSKRLSSGALAIHQKHKNKS